MPSSSAIAEPRQQRSRRTLKRILDAFETALDTQTFEEVTVGAICKKAGCSVGTFYGRVESKDVLLDHLRQRLFEEVSVTLATLFAPDRAQSVPLSELLKQQLEVLVDFHLERRGVLRAVIVQARRQTAFAGPTREFNASLLRLAASSWLVHREQMQHPDPVLAVEQAILMTAGYLRESIVFSELWQTERAPDRDAHVQQLSRMLTSYLLAPAP
ncbi:MAG: TetR/AcrR family transcriptional regulator [Myxococcota bacterium]